MRCIRCNRNDRLSRLRRAEIKLNCARLKAVATKRAPQDRYLFLGTVDAGFWFGWVEAIADPGFGVDVTRMTRVGFDFAAQLIDEDAQVFGFFSVVGSPNGWQEAAVGLRLAGIGNQLA